MTTPSAELPSVNPSGRVQRVPVPTVAPGQCGMCGKAEHPLGFADPKLDYDFYGTLYFCGDCVGDIASVFGFASPADISALRDHVHAQDVELNTLRQAVLGLESAVDGLTNYRDLRGHADDTRRRSPELPLVANTPDQPTNAGENAKGPDSLPGGSVSEVPTGEPKADTLSVEQGRDDVHSTPSASLDELLNL